MALTAIHHSETSRSSASGDHDDRKLWDQSLNQATGKTHGEGRSAAATTTDHGPAARGGDVAGGAGHPAAGAGAGGAGHPAAGAGADGAGHPAAGGGADRAGHSAAGGGADGAGHPAAGGGAGGSGRAADGGGAGGAANGGHPDGLRNAFSRRDGESRADFGARLDNTLKPFTLPLAVGSEVTGAASTVAILGENSNPISKN